MRAAVLICLALVLLLPPAAAAADPVIAAAGDIASSSSGDTATAKVLDTLNPSLVLTLGDNAYESGTSAQFNSYYEPTWGRHKSKTRPSPGNHDYKTSGASGYFGYFGSTAGPSGRGYYSFDVGSWHLVSLNSEIARDAGSSQVGWLKSDLAATTQPCILAYWHKPRFSSGPHGSDASLAPIWDALAAVRADVVLAAHDHLYERFAPQTSSGAADPIGVRQFVVGTGGRSHYQVGTVRANSVVRNSDSYGVLALTLRPSSFEWRFVPEAGRTFADSGSASCHGPSDQVAPSAPTNLRASASSPTTVDLSWNAAADNVGIAGYDVYFVADASGATSKEAHDMAVQRMIQAGAVPLTGPGPGESLA
jgi:acid phosphatase type 7